MSGKLISQGADPLIVKRLAEMIEQGDDMSLARLRAYALADYWNVSRRAVLETCLWATRVGLLDLQWDLLCPHCQSAAQTSPTLTGIHSQFVVILASFIYGQLSTRRLTFPSIMGLLRVETFLSASAAHSSRRHNISTTAPGGAIVPSSCRCKRVAILRSTGARRHLIVSYTGLTK